MHALPPVYALNILLVLLSGYSHYVAANPSSPSQTNLEGTSEPPTAPLPFKMGECYYFTNPKGEHLGSDGSGYSYLKFGSNNYRRPFRVCKERDKCVEEDEEDAAQAGPNFWLQDLQGSYWATGKNIVAGNDNGKIYPSYGFWTNYLQFTGTKDCDLDSEEECYFQLKLTGERRHYNGLEVSSDNYVTVSREQQRTIPIKFNKVDCPPDRKEDEL